MERQYILDAIDAALCAGKDILSIYNDPTSDFQIEKKADNYLAAGTGLSLIHI